MSDTRSHEAMNQDIEEAPQLDKHSDEHVQHTHRLQSLGQLAGRMAHDFNNLLTVVMANAEMARFELPTDAPQRKRVTEILSASRRASEICSQLQAYAGRNAIHNAIIQMPQFLDDMKPMIGMAASKKLLLEYELNAVVPVIEADPGQLRQVVMSLIANASEAIGDGNGQITVSTGGKACSGEDFESGLLGYIPEDGNYAYVEVTDTGCGMDSETQAAIFDPFYTTKPAASGLGLAAVLGIVRACKGAIDVSSNPGAGSSIRLWFPAFRVPLEKESTPEPEQGDSKAEGVHLVDLSAPLADTVLLIDDDEKVLNVTSKMLKRIGFHVLTAENGKDGMRCFQKNAQTLTCVIIDMNMPGMTGDETLAKFRQTKPDIPALLISGYTARNIEQKAVAKGRTGYIQKPFLSTELKVKIDDLIHPAVV